MEYQRVIRKLDESLAAHLEYQVLDESRIDYGGFFNANMEFALPSHVGNADYIKRLGLCYFAPISRFHLNPNILHRLLIAIAFQKHCQRESGFIDIPSTNFDSPSDTAFAMGCILPVVYLAKKHPSLPGSAEIWNALEPYLLSSARAVAQGGFHTPNHRWGNAWALAEAQELFGDEIDLRPAIDAYLAEGIDMNADGFYSEKSTGGYNATCNMALIAISEAYNRPELLEYVNRCLECMLDLMHHDWTIVTHVSLRQDLNKKVVPTNSINSFYYMARKTGDSRFCAASKALLNKGGDGNANLAFLFLKHDEWQQSDLPDGAIEEKFTRHMPDSGIWRIRNHRISATVTTGSDSIFSLKYGDMEIKAVRAYLPYFAGSKFILREMDIKGDTAALTLTSDFLLPQLPGYWLPLGRPVPFDDLPYKKLEERMVIPRPEFTIKALITHRENAFDFQIKTLGGMKQVPFLLEILLDAPVWVETKSLSFQGQRDQTLILKEGEATFHSRRDALTIKGGFYGHRQINCPNPESATGSFRVVMTDWSDVDVSITIETGKYNPAEGECCSKKGPASINP